MIPSIMEEFSRLNFKIPGTQPHTIPWVWILRTSPTIRSFLRQGYSYFQNHLRRLHYAFHLKGPDEVFKMFVELNTTLCIFKAFINWLLRLHREIWFNNKKPWRGAWYWPVLTVAQQSIRTQKTKFKKIGKFFDKFIIKRRHLSCCCAIIEYRFSKKCTF